MYAHLTHFSLQNTAYVHTYLQMYESLALVDLNTKLNFQAESVIKIARSPL